VRPLKSDVIIQFQKIIVLNLKNHIILIGLLTTLSFTSPFFPEPINSLYFVFFIVSFVSCSIVGLTAIFRNRDKKGLFSLNPITQTKASASISLNKIEKTILIYAVFTFLGCIFAALFSPVIGNFLGVKL
jgi:hypothetical protein